MTESKTILVVEDTEDVLTITQRMLEALGYTVLTARDGKEAFRIYSDHPGRISLVLADAAMPEMDGISLLEAIRKANPAAKGILMSAYDVRELAAAPRIEKLGGLLQKPVSLRTLRDVIQCALME